MARRVSYVCEVRLVKVAWSDDEPSIPEELYFASMFCGWSDRADTSDHGVISIWGKSPGRVLPLASLRCYKRTNEMTQASSDKDVIALRRVDTRRFISAQWARG